MFFMNLRVAERAFAIILQFHHEFVLNFSNFIGKHLRHSTYFLIFFFILDIVFLVPAGDHTFLEILR